MIDDPGVQRQIVDLVTTNLTARVDLQGYVHSTTTRIVANDRFAALFRQSLRNSHAFLIQTLTGNCKHLRVKDGTVVLDLSTLRNQVVAKVQASTLGNFIELAK